MAPSDVESAWLDYAWRVVNWPKSHADPCLAAGGLPQSDTPEGRHNDLRWPGYVGRNYEPERGVLCLAAVGRQPPQYTPDQARDYAEMGRVHRTWLEAGRSEDADADFLERHREYYEVALPTWPRWNNLYRTFVEADLGMNVAQISFGNLAKCRANEADTELLARVCQQVFPVSELVAALRPIAVVVAMLNARGIVRSWRGNSHQPLVWTFQGRNGKGQDGRRFAEWGPDLADAIRARMS